MDRAPVRAPKSPEPGGTEPSLHQAVEQTYRRVLQSLGAEREQREGQRQMLQQVASSIQDRQHRVIHAGTGVGKSLGYLVPIRAALETQRLERVVVSTATRALQDQLLRKDLPLVFGSEPGVFQVLKGRSNYLCVDKLRQGVRDWEQSQSLLSGPQELDQDTRRFLALVRWHESLMRDPEATGERTSLPEDLQVPDSLWDRVSTRSEECPGADTCPSGRVCWAERARLRAREARVVVVNHHLWVLGAAKQGESLPSHQLLVLDEAHELLDIAARALGCQLSPGVLFARARQLSQLLGRGGGERQRPVRDLTQVAQDLGAALARARSGVSLPDQDPRVREELVQTVLYLGTLLARLRLMLQDQIAQVSGTDAGSLRRLGALQRAERSLSAVLDTAQRLGSTEDGSNQVTWVESSSSGQQALVQAMVDPSVALRAAVWDSGPPALLCSATFHPAFTQWVGLGEGERWGGLHQVPSPFDYRNQGLLYVPKGLPAPPSEGRDQPRFWERQLAEVRRLLELFQGDALVLFTSWRALRFIGDRLQQGWSLPGPLLRQDSEASRAQLMHQFVHQPHSVLLGVRSFWQGVDVRGEALRLVVIDRLPFPSPKDPLIEARSRAAQRRGKRPFDHVQLPVAAQLLAQGVGRLIRSSADWGAVAVLDSRLAETSYRSQLLDQLPPMRRTREFSQVQDWVQRHRAAHLDVPTRNEEE